MDMQQARASALQAAALYIGVTQGSHEEILNLSDRFAHYVLTGSHADPAEDAQQVADLAAKAKTRQEVRDLRARALAQGLMGRDVLYAGRTGQLGALLDRLGAALPSDGKATPGRSGKMH